MAWCTLCFWLFGIGSLIVGALAAWFWRKRRIDELEKNARIDRSKIIQLESEYASLRTSSANELMDLKSANSNLAYKLKTSQENELNVELKNQYEKLSEEYEMLKSQSIKGDKNDGKWQTKYEDLIQSYNTLLAAPDSLSDDNQNISEIKAELGKKLKSQKKKNKKRSKKIKKLISENERLNKELSKEKSTEGIKQKVEIRKSLKVDKLLDWLKKDKAYKVKKKVSTQKLEKK
jgi:hypothetical protein